MVAGAWISDEISAVGSVHTGNSSHRWRTSTHIFTKNSQDGVQGSTLSLEAHRTDHNALTTLHSTRRTGVVRDNSRLTQSRVLTSVEGPSGVFAGPIHCTAMCVATVMYLHEHMACSLVSNCPSKGHCVPLGCQLVSRSPTVRFFHNGFCINNSSSGGMDSLSQAFHTCVPCRGGTGVKEDKYLRLFCVFHSIQSMGLASPGVADFCLIAGCANCLNPRMHTGSHVRGMQSFCSRAVRPAVRCPAAGEGPRCR